MVLILDTNEINMETDAVVDNARKHLVLISPFLDINARLRTSIEIAVRRGVKLTVIYGKKRLDPDTLQWLRSLPYCNLGFVPNLHAKLILNEEAALMSSMNLYEFSQVSNEELGMLAWKRDGRGEFKELLFHAVRIINLSEKQLGEWDIGDIDAPLRGVVRKETYFIPVTGTTGLPEPEPPAAQERRICHCIRCGRSIPSDHPYVYCGRCLESWERYANTRYVEPDGRCYICGMPCGSSAERPVCTGCYRDHAELVRQKADAMRGLIGRP